jgi:hypothetical protein
MMKDSKCKDQSSKTSVSCCVKECVHNASEQCTADHINIAGSHPTSCKETECDSFCC